LAQRVQLARNPFLALESTDLPLFSDYGSYLLGLLRLDFGTIPGGDQTVLQAMWEAGINSLGLLVIAFALSVLFGFLLGLQAARHNPPAVAGWLTSVSTIGQAIPSFYVGSLLIVGSLFYAIQRGAGTAPPLPLQGFGWDLHLVMPVAALMIRPTVQIAQFTATVLVDELRKQYVVVSRSAGHTWRDIRWRLAMRNVLAPIILAIAGSARFLIVEIVVVEWLFTWPGIGRIFARTLVPSTVIAVSGQTANSQVYLNAPLIAALIMGMVGVFLLTDLVASVLGHDIDPRLRVAEERVHSVG
jgi:peptide/nickel transport system permease protein